VGWPLTDVTIQPLATEHSLDKNGLTFTEAWIRTPNQCLNPGDLLSISRSGQVIFGGRSNDVFLFNSILISPLEIEDVLRQHPGVEDCAAFGAHSTRFGSIPMAAFTTNPDWPRARVQQELEVLCRDALGTRRPRKLIIMDEIPKGNTGKALRRELSRLHALQG
jgi:long-chain acyl-CoA synthetase